MPKGSHDGSIFKRKELRVVFKGSKRDEKEIEQYYARVRYTDQHGREREKKRRAVPNTYAQACTLKRALVAEIEEELQELQPPAPVDRTFKELSDHYSENYLIPPKYVAGKKVEGLRSYKKLETPLKVLREEFADVLLRDIDFERIKLFKSKRLSTPVMIVRKDRRTRKETVESRQRSVAAIDRELQLLRRMLNVARHKSWIVVDPFRAADPLIVVAHETKRMLILSHEEESNLLTACGDRTVNVVWKDRPLAYPSKEGRRKMLRPAIICAIDTGLRFNEQFTLTQDDVSLDDLVIRVREMNAKVERERHVPVSARLRVELEKILSETPRDASALIFPQSVIRAFENARRYAGLSSLRWHDLRHTAIMRMLESGLPESEVMKITGHTSWTTFMRYVTLNKERLRAAAGMLDAYRARKEAEAKEKEERETVH